MIDLFFLDREGNPVPGKTPTPLHVVGGEINTDSYRRCVAAFNRFNEEIRLSTLQSHRRVIRIDSATEMVVQYVHGVFTAYALVRPPKEKTPEFFGGIVINPTELTIDGQTYTEDAIPALYDAAMPSAPGHKDEACDRLVISVARTGDLTATPVAKGVVRILRIKSPMVGRVMSHTPARSQYIVTAAPGGNNLTAFYLCGKELASIPPMPEHSEPFNPDFVRLVALGFNPAKFDWTVEPEGALLVAWHQTLYACRKVLGAYQWTVVASSTDTRDMVPYGFSFTTTNVVGAISVVCAGTNAGGVMSGFSAVLNEGGAVSGSTNIRFLEPLNTEPIIEFEKSVSWTNHDWMLHNNAVPVVLKGYRSTVSGPQLITTDTTGTMNIETGMYAVDFDSAANYTKQFPREWEVEPFTGAVAESKSPNIVGVYSDTLTNVGETTSRLFDGNEMPEPRLVFVYFWDGAQGNGEGAGFTFNDYTLTGAWYALINPLELYAKHPASRTGEQSMKYVVTNAAPFLPAPITVDLVTNKAGTYSPTEHPEIYSWYSIDNWFSPVTNYARSSRAVLSGPWSYSTPETSMSGAIDNKLVSYYAKDTHRKKLAWRMTSRVTGAWAVNTEYGGPESGGQWQIADYTLDEGTCKAEFVTPTGVLKTVNLATIFPGLDGMAHTPTAFDRFSLPTPYNKALNLTDTTPPSKTYIEMFFGKLYKFFKNTLGMWVGDPGSTAAWNAQSGYEPGTFAANVVSDGSPLTHSEFSALGDVDPTDLASWPDPIPVDLFDEFNQEDFFDIQFDPVGVTSERSNVLVDPRTDAYITQLFVKGTSGNGTTVMYHQELTVGNSTNTAPLAGIINEWLSMNTPAGETAPQVTRLSLAGNDAEEALLI